MPSAPDLPAPDRRYTSGPSGVRARIEQASAPVLKRLAGLPAVVPFIAMAALMLTGAFLGGAIGALLLLVPVVFLCWLLYLTWPHLSRAERSMRGAVLLFVVAIAVTQVVSR